MSLDSLCIDSVVLLVCADKLDENNPIRIVDGCDQPVLVASDIEDYTSILQDARGTEVGLDVRRGLPLGLEDMSMPGKERLFRVSILRSFVEAPKGR